jgi:hypothetical protein
MVQLACDAKALPVHPDEGQVTPQLPPVWIANSLPPGKLKVSAPLDRPPLFVMVTVAELLVLVMGVSGNAVTLACSPGAPAEVPVRAAVPFCALPETVVLTVRVALTDAGVLGSTGRSSRKARFTHAPAAIVASVTWSSVTAKYPATAAGVIAKLTPVAEAVAWLQMVKIFSVPAVPWATDPKSHCEGLIETGPPAVPRTFAVSVPATDPLAVMAPFFVPVVCGVNDTTMVQYGT